MAAKAQQITKMKALIKSTLLEMQEMKVDIFDYLDELHEELENKDENDEKTEQNITHNKISLLVKEDPKWCCDKGHSVHYIIGKKWTNDKCVGCSANKGKVCKCESCENYDKIFDTNNYDETTSKYLWCEQCAKQTNPLNVKKQIKINHKICKRVINTLNNNPQISIDLWTGLKNKNALVYLLNEISINKEKHKYSLYVFDIDNFKALNETLGHDGADQILKALGQILLKCEQTTQDDFQQTQPSISRCWSFRQGGDEFAIITERPSLFVPVSRQESFYKLFNDEINKLNITISVGMCCTGLGNSFTYSNINKAKDWLSFSDKALYKTKNRGKNSITIFDSYKGKYVKSFKVDQIGNTLGGDEDNDEYVSEDKFEMYANSTWQDKNIAAWCVSELQGWIVTLNLDEMNKQILVDSIGEQEIGGIDFNDVQSVDDIHDTFPELNRNAAKLVYKQLQNLR